MKANKVTFENIANRAQLIFSLLLLIIGLLAGMLAAMVYARQHTWVSGHSFVTLRPMHVSCVLLWILSAAQSLINTFSFREHGKPEIPWIKALRIGLLIFGAVAIIISYTLGQFGGREYWEFPRYLFPAFLGSWVLQLFSFVQRIKRLPASHVYVWMWSTGALFLVLIYLENYLWLLPHIQESGIKDMLIQWKSAGSMVGAWNQQIYGLAIYLQVKTTGNDKPARSGLAFALYFLGLTNLMFNWGHHIYTLPTENYIRIISYVISMTEWILLFRLIYFWPGRKSFREYRSMGISGFYLYAADFWVILNLLLALLMSIPAVNIYTHGTHITVAHSMGATIGINSMILMGAFFYLTNTKTESVSRRLRISWLVIQLSLLIFWLSLIAAGITKGLWMHQPGTNVFSSLMIQLRPYFMVFAITGSILALTLIGNAIHLLRRLARKNPDLYEHSM